MATIYTTTPTNTTRVVERTTTTDEIPVIQQEVVTTTPVQTTVPASYKINQLIWFIFTIIEVIIALRFVLALLGARNTGFTQFIYSLSYPFVAPFIGMFNSPRVDRSYFDTAAIVALIVWPLVAWAITSLVRMLDSRRV